MNSRHEASRHLGEM